MDCVCDLQISGKPEWFSRVYRPFILSMAKIAEEEKVDLFAVGSEYAGTIDRTAEWLQTIREVRAVYKGKLTYVGNHDVRLNCSLLLKHRFFVQMSMRPANFLRLF